MRYLTLFPIAQFPLKWFLLRRFSQIQTPQNIFPLTWFPLMGFQLTGFSLMVFPLMEFSLTGFSLMVFPLMEFSLTWFPPPLFSRFVPIFIFAEKVLLFYIPFLWRKTAQVCTRNYNSLIPSPYMKIHPWSRDLGTDRKPILITSTITQFYPKGNELWGNGF